MSGLGRCSVCSRDAGVMYPLLAGSPAFCSDHHNSKDAGPFGCDFTGPDDFDPPLWNEEPEFREPILQRRRFVWTDKDGNDHKLKDIDNYYLMNIINFLTRKDNEELTRTIAFLKKEVEKRKKESIGSKDGR